MDEKNRQKTVTLGEEDFFPGESVSMEQKFRVVRPSTEETANFIDPFSDHLQQSFEMAEEATPKPTDQLKLPGMSECPQIFVNDEQVHLSPLKTPTGEGSWEGEQTRCNGQQEDDEEEKEMSVEDDSDNSSTDTDDSFSFSESRTLTLVHTQNIPHINGQDVSEKHWNLCQKPMTRA